MLGTLERGCLLQWGMQVKDKLFSNYEVDATVDSHMKLEAGQSFRP
jgi:hypothetical protein